MKRFFYTLIALWITNSSPVQAQVLSINNDSFHMTTFDYEFVVYQVFEMLNLTNQDLPVEFEVFNSGNGPGQWYMEVDYPRSQGYQPHWTGQFDVPVDSNQYRVFFLSVQPNNTPGFDTFYVKLTPTQYPNEVYWVEFQVEVYNTSSTSNHLVQQAWNLYPNPCQDVLHINSASAAEVFITDIQGRVLQAAPLVEGLNQIKTSDIPQGAFILQYKNSAGQSSCRKAVKR